ncbi:hypothetical protein GOODEAATRI_007689 [Goodea atripinnis]|uniref:Uncharacterized protein n=1 Tax=Goodea atripinnis TaxID=208336 RepID=A0ABV0MG14_9TELE
MYNFIFRNSHLIKPTLFCIFFILSICLLSCLGHALLPKHINLCSCVSSPPKVSVCLPAYLLLPVHCVISGSLESTTKICKSAPLVLSISDRIILKQHRGPCPCLSASSATTHQADRSSKNLTLVAFFRLFIPSQLMKKTVTQENLDSAENLLNRSLNLL